MRMRTGLVVAAIWISAIGTAEAGGSSIDAGARAKVMSTLAKTYQKGKAPDGSTVVRGDVVQTGCGGVNVGVITDPKAARNLREQITVITGDVINAPGRHCRR